GAVSATEVSGAAAAATPAVSAGDGTLAGISSGAAGGVGSGKGVDGAGPDSNWASTAATWAAAAASTALDSATVGAVAALREVLRFRLLGSNGLAPGCGTPMRATGA